MRLDPNQISIVVASYDGEILSVAIDGVVMPTTIYCIIDSKVIFNDGRWFGLYDLLNR